MKESFDIGVISKEEFEEGKQRIEAKLKELEKPEEEKPKEDIQIKEIKEEAKLEEQKDDSQLKLGEEKEKEAKEEIPKEKEEIKHEPINEEKLKEEIPEEKPKEVEEKKEEVIKEEKQEEAKVGTEAVKYEEDHVSDAERDVEEPQEIDEEIKIGKKTLVFLAIILIGLGSWYFFFMDKPESPVQDDDVFSPVIDEPTVTIACHSDEDCMEEGKIGVCSNPGQETAECEFIEDVEVKLIVLNSEACFNCGTGRVMSILKSFYPNLDVENIDLETEEGGNLVESFNINTLPAYILGSSFVDAQNYGKLSNAFDEVNGNFIMRNSVANANYYFEREEISNKLDLFLQEGQEASLQAEENLKEFLETFDNKVEFEMHDSNDRIVEELGISTFPTFLINNRIKFSGVQPADIIKVNFCQLNQADECDLELSKSLV